MEYLTNSSGISLIFNDTGYHPVRSQFPRSYSCELILDLIYIYLYLYFNFIKIKAFGNTNSYNIQRSNTGNTLNYGPSFLIATDPNKQRSSKVRFKIETHAHDSFFIHVLHI